MFRCSPCLVGLLLPCAALAQTAASSSPMLHASYGTYAAGVRVAEVDAAFSFGQRNYQLNLGYHTTGVAAAFFRGHQIDSVSGTWMGDRAAPARFLGQGRWNSMDRVVQIDYLQGNPIISRLVPPNDKERETVSTSLQANTVDSLSALAELIRVVKDTGRCETTVRTFDGRRALKIEAHTIGEETLEPNPRSSFAGKALRCDFTGRMLAGFKFEGDRIRDSHPAHGTAWLASVAAGAPPLPVRMAFETRWFSDATMYLTGISPATGLRVTSGE